MVALRSTRRFNDFMTTSSRFRGALVAAAVIMGTSGVAAAVTTTFTSAQVVAAVNAASTMSTAPDLTKTSPTLANAAVPGGPIFHIYPNCYPGGAVGTMPAYPTSQCVGGSPTSKYVIVMLGDSQAGMWFTTFDQIGKDLNYKVVLIAKQGCSPYLQPSTSSAQLYGGFSLAQCYQRDLAAIAATVKIKTNLIVIDGDSTFLPSSVGSPSGSVDNSASVLAPQIAATLTALAPAKAPVIIPAPIPQYEGRFGLGTPASCLSTHSTSVTSCLLSGTGPFGPSSQAITAALATESKAKLANVIATQPLFCASTGQHLCPLWVTLGTTSYLVHSDPWHMTNAYATVIARAVESIAAAYLPRH